MCGRYEVHTPIEEIARRFDARLTEEAATLPPRYNAAPSLRIPVIRADRDGRRVDAMTWGLVPSWAKDLSGVKPINARAETVFDKPMFRNAVRRRRCLIPADGFYEWQQGPGRKRPWHIGMADDDLFALGGLWEYWVQEGAQPLVSCAILVTAANPLMATIHDRMPVIIRPEYYSRWLATELTEPSDILPMLAVFPAERMRAYPVSTRVNNARNEGADLIAPLSG
jgi:putative SOS response-associated peptidase YedK